MYARQGPQGRFPRNLHIPQNYSGNAFRKEEKITEDSAELPEEEAIAAVVEPAPAEDAQQAPKKDGEIPAGRLFPSPGFRLDLGRFFKGERGFGIGFEELLIIGLILLVAQGDAKDDLIFLLLLLLFVQ